MIPIQEFQKWKKKTRGACFWEPSIKKGRKEKERTKGKILKRKGRKWWLQ